MGLLLIAALIIGAGLGVAGTLMSGKVAQIAGRDGQEVRKLRKALNLAKTTLGEIRSGTSGRPELSAEIALFDIEKEEIA